VTGSVLANNKDVIATDDLGKLFMEKELGKTSLCNGD
jgi:hypothetical protein